MFAEKLDQNKVIALETKQSHVLVVDDDEDNLTLLTHILNRHHRVSTTTSGQDALDLIKSGQYDAVLLDVMMPGMNGIDVLRHIRDDSTLDSLPVIMVSALSDSKNIVESLKVGANDYITKPIDVNVTLARLQTQIKLKRLQDEREKAIHDLETVQAMRDRLFRVATHDLKNPLANIRMAEFVLRESVADDPVAAQTMQTVSASLDTMQEVIEDFMDVVVLQSGKIDLKMECVDVGKVIYNAALQYSVSADKKQINVDIADSSAKVIADIGRLTQVIGNLLSNALKYSDPQTTVRIWTEEHDGHVRVLISDEGPGIPGDERNLLYTEFGKLSPRPTGQESSTGLGLWIVKNLIELMNGTVGAIFPPGGGSVFWVELPKYHA